MNLRRHHRPLNCLLGLFAALGFGLASAPAQELMIDQEAYVEPPAIIRDSVTAPWHENENLQTLSPDGSCFLITTSDGMTSLERMARPFVSLGETQFDPQAHRSRRLTTRNSAGYALHFHADGRRVAVATPEGARVSGARFSPDGSQIAFLALFKDSTQLWVAKVENGEARALTTRPLLATQVTSFEWSADSSKISAVFRPEGATPPARPAIATEPMVRVNRDGNTPSRTYRFLMKTPYDKALYEYLSTGQLATVSVADGTLTPIGDPAMIRAFDASPDAKHFRVTKILKPFSYFQTARAFGSRETLTDAEGKELQEISKREMRSAGARRDPAALAAAAAAAKAAEEKGEAPKRSLSWRPDGAGLSFLQLEPEPKKKEPKKKPDDAKPAPAKPAPAKPATAKPAPATPTPAKPAATKPGADAAKDQAKPEAKPEKKVRKDRVMLWVPPYGDKDIRVVYESEKPIRSVQYDAKVSMLFLTRSEEGKQTINVVDLENMSKEQLIFSGEAPQPRGRGRAAAPRVTRTPPTTPPTTTPTPGTRPRGAGTRPRGTGTRGAGRRGAGRRGAGRRGADRGSDGTAKASAKKPEPEKERGAKKGRLMTRSSPSGANVVRVSERAAVYFQGSEPAPEEKPGPARPFIDSVDIQSGEVKRVHLGDAALQETIAAVSSDEMKQVFVRREGKNQVPNTFAVTLENKEARQLTKNVDHADWYRRLKVERFQVRRVDGFKFWVKVTKNSDYGMKLPALFWFYPREFTDQKTYDARSARAGRPSYRFSTPSTRSMTHLTQLGYVIVEPDMPIVGPEGRPNDNYITDLRNGLWAVIDELDKREIIDRDRLAIGGHSYGAFSAANAMAHTPFFKAGIAGDGCFNRTLTPMSFQAERRYLWDARETYIGMSPLLWADQVNGALLMYHGAEDTNTGTFPINSERMFQALDGLGKDTSMYMYPYEGHGPAARETILDLWARWVAWLDRYVKHPAEPEEEKAATPASASPRG